MKIAFSAILFLLGLIILLMAFPLSWVTAYVPYWNELQEHKYDIFGWVAFLYLLYPFFLYFRLLNITPWAQAAVFFHVIFSCCLIFFLVNLWVDVESTTDISTENIEFHLFWIRCLSLLFVGEKLVFGTYFIKSRRKKAKVAEVADANLS